MDVELTKGEAIFDLPFWDDLVAAFPHRHVFATRDWNRAWWEEFAGGKSLFGLTFMDPHPVAFAPLMTDRTVYGRRLRFLGGDDLTDYLGPIVSSDGALPGVTDALLSYLCDEVPDWQYIEARCLPVPFGFAEHLVESADRRGMPFEIDQTDLTAVLPLPEDFETYIERLPGKKRHELRRKIRRFDREAPGWSLRSASANLDEDVHLFIEMHKGSEGLKGKFMLPERASFFARVADALYPTGVLSLDFLEVDGAPIAATFSFVYDNVFYLYNSAYSKSFSSLAPGLMIVARLIERSIHQGHLRFDFLRGRERYKFDLGAEAIPLHAVKLQRD